MYRNFEDIKLSIYRKTVRCFCPPSPGIVVFLLLQILMENIGISNIEIESVLFFVRHRIEFDSDIRYLISDTQHCQLSQRYSPGKRLCVHREWGRAEAATVVPGIFFVPVVRRG